MLHLDYHPTPEILRLIAFVSEKLGETTPYYQGYAKDPSLVKHRIDTIHAIVQFEGSTLKPEQVDDIMHNRIVKSTFNRILEVTNINRVFRRLNELNPLSEDSFLQAHGRLSGGLDADQ